MPAGTFGRQTLGTTAAPLMALAGDPGKASWKVGGITIDWSLVTAVSADTTLLDGSVIPNGRKYLRYGQVMTRANAAEVQTATWTGGPTGGSAIITAPAIGDLPGGNFTAPWNATAASFEALLLAAYGGAPVASVARTGAGSAGDPYVYSVTFNRIYGNVAAFVNVSHTFTGGTSPSSTLGTTTPGTGTGLFGPYNPGASDGTQTLVRGECFILNETITEVPLLGFGSPQSTVVGALDGGTFWKERLLVTTGAASLADGPTVSAFETAFPLVRYAE